MFDSEHWGVFRCVDWDRVGMGQRLIVKSGVDEGVDVLRSKYSALPQLLKQLVTLEVEHFCNNHQNTRLIVHTLCHRVFVWPKI